MRHCPGSRLAGDGVAWYGMTCYNPAMSYQVTLPPDIERRLSTKASETGQDVVHLIQTAVVQFVEREQVTPHNGDGDWSAEMDVRRCDLIDRDISGTITAAERAELAVLQQRASEHFDRIAPPPIEGARRLHQQLVTSRARRD